VVKREQPDRGSRSGFGDSGRVVRASIASRASMMGESDSRNVVDSRASIPSELSSEVVEPYNMGPVVAGLWR